ncbi:MAG: hypothetical protein M3367_08100 [Acidobacteriota bacterium]|nr:hypothetical protein [Acidobacteriota bacterium]
MILASFTRLSAKRQLDTRLSAWERASSKLPARFNGFINWLKKRPLAFPRRSNQPRTAGLIAACGGKLDESG